MARAFQDGLSMRVLLVTGSFPPMRCGVGDYTHGVAQALAAVPGIHVAVLTSVHAGKPVRTDGIEVFPVMDGWRLIEAQKVRNAIRQFSPDVVHMQYPTRGYGRGNLPRMVPIIASMMGTKVVRTWHESFHPKSWLKVFLMSVVRGGLVVVRPNYRELLPKILHWALRNQQYDFIPNASGLPVAALRTVDATALRERYLKGQKRLIVFFGFVYRNKGVELLFELADPASDHIVIAGEVVEASDYHRKISALASAEPWAGKVTVTAFLPADDIAALLSVADAVILPYREGGGEWNTSIHAAVMQRSFVITTSLTRHGYDAKRNTFFARVNDVADMRSALNEHGGTKRGFEPDIDRDEWKEIARRHVAHYEALPAKSL